MSEDLGLELSWPPLERARALLEGAAEDLGRSRVPAPSPEAWGGAAEAPAVVAAHASAEAAYVARVGEARRALALVADALLALRREVEEQERAAEADLRTRRDRLAGSAATREGP